MHTTCLFIYCSRFAYHRIWNMILAKLFNVVILKVNRFTLKALTYSAKSQLLGFSCAIVYDHIQSLYFYNLWTYDFNSILDKKQILSCPPSQGDFSKLLKKTHTETAMPLKTVWNETVSSEKASSPISLTITGQIQQPSFLT